MAEGDTSAVLVRLDGEEQVAYTVRETSKGCTVRHHEGSRVTPVHTIYHPRPSQLREHLMVLLASVLGAVGYDARVQSRYK